MNFGYLMHLAISFIFTYFIRKMYLQFKRYQHIYLNGWIKIKYYLILHLNEVFCFVFIFTYKITYCMKLNVYWLRATKENWHKCTWPMIVLILSESHQDLCATEMFFPSMMFPIMTYKCFLNHILHFTKFSVGGIQHVMKKWTQRDLRFL